MGCNLMTGQAVARGRGNQLLLRHRRQGHHHRRVDGEVPFDLYQFKDHLATCRDRAIDLSGWRSLWGEFQWWDIVKVYLVWTTP